MEGLWKTELHIHASRSLNKQFLNPPMKTEKSAKSYVAVVQKLRTK